MKKLSFIGTGSAFSKTYPNNSAYYIVDDKIILFDCGETVFSEIIKKDILLNIKYIDIIITHFHSDHVGSIGTLLFYCRYKGIKVNVIFPREEIIEKLLNIFGINKNMYNILLPNKVEDYYLKEYKQIHGDICDGKLVEMPAYGYHLKIGNLNIFYSGDCSKVNKEVINLFKRKEIDILYHEVATDGYKAHVDLKELQEMIDKEDRKRVVLMHMSDDINLKEIKSLGFKTAR